MWELICHHQYSWGTIAADRSPFHTDGFTSGVSPIAGGGLKFSTADSRVVIPRRNGDPWSSMRAVHVEIVASPLQAGGTVVDADGSFRISFEGLQNIVVEILGHTFREGINGVPPGASIGFQFTHDGVNQFTYGYGWEAVVGTGAQSGLGGGSPIDIPGAVPPVGPKGVWFGNRIGHTNLHLNGGLSSVKIWRADPQDLPKTFLGRPFTPPEVKCWGGVIRKIRDMETTDPECSAWLSNLIKQQQDQVVQLLGQKDRAVLDEFYQICAAYRQLWLGGKVGGPEMQDLMVKLRNWLKTQGILSIDDPGLQETLQNPCVAKLREAVGSIDCDPDAQALLKAILGLPNS